MNSKEFNEFKRKILEDSGLRKKLREEVPAIARLEQLEGLQDLTLTGVNLSAILLLYYDAKASAGLYPDVDKALIEKGVIRNSDVIRYDVKNKGSENEYEVVHFGAGDSKIQVSLDVYKPKS